MKKIILITLFSLLSLSTAHADYVLEAKALKDIASAIQSTKFKYKERGMIFGYNTIESCLYISQDMVIVKNYCYPAKKYPAKSFTIISPKYGMIDLYEEDFFGVDNEENGLNKVIKHDVRITAFPDILKDYFSGDLNQETIDSVNVNIEKMYNAHYPACWSTNAHYSDSKPDWGCYRGSVDNILGLQDWFDETQAFTADDKGWNQLFQNIEAVIKK